jgi:hypothetical protein
MCTYIDIFYYILYLTKKVKGSFGLEGSPVGLMSASFSLLPPTRPRGSTSKLGGVFSPLERLYRWQLRLAWYVSLTWSEGCA